MRYTLIVIVLLSFNSYSFANGANSSAWKEYLSFTKENQDKLNPKNPSWHPPSLMELISMFDIDFFTTERNEDSKASYDEYMLINSLDEDDYTYDDYLEAKSIVNQSWINGNYEHIHLSFDGNEYKVIGRSPGEPSPNFMNNGQISSWKKFRGK